MPSWADLLNDIRTRGSTHDIIRREALRALSDYTKRNTIIYYSGWLQKPGAPNLDVNDSDKNGFMATVQGLDRKLGLDLVIHTPGGSAGATESLVDYLRQMFATDIRVIVPQLAMSAGTMIACAAKKIIMAKHSSLGPIDPQIAGLAAHGIVEEFERALKEIRADSSGAAKAVWQPILSKYPPSLIGACEKAIEWSREIVTKWLESGMFPGKSELAAKIVRELGDHAGMKAHDRHLSAQRCLEIGLDIEMLESDQQLQERVLSVHHACVHTLTATGAVKIIENQKGVAFISMQQHVLVGMPPQVSMMKPEETGEAKTIAPPV